MKKISIAFASLLMAQLSWGQNLAEKAVEKILKEKIRYDISKISPNQTPSAEWYEEWEREHKAARLSQFGEMIVSDVPEIESEIHAAISLTDTMKMVTSANSTPVGGGLPAAGTPINYLYYSQDFGSSWQKSSFLPIPTDASLLVLGGGDPMFAASKTGRIYTSWINLSLQGFSTAYWDMLWAYSDDGGQTWSRGNTPQISSASGPATALFTGDFSQFSGPISDKQWMMVDNNPSSPYYGDLYCAFFEADMASGAQSIAVRKKAASSNDFTQVSTNASVSNFLFIQFNSLDIDKSGNVHLAFFASTDTLTYSLYHTVSTDGAATFSNPVKISDVQLPNYSVGQKGTTIDGISLDRIYPCPSISCNPSQNELYTVWTANGISSKLNNGVDIYFSKSTDNGATWSPAKVVNNNNNATDQFYPAMAVSPNGVLAIAWYDRRNYSGNLLTDYYMTYSFDGGNTFINDFAVSSTPSDFAQIGSQNGDFGIGEYNEIICTPTQAIPFWSDGRTNDGDIDIYMGVLPITQMTTHIGSQAVVNSDLSLSLPYPNPVSDKATVSLSANKLVKGDLYLFSAEGKIVKTWEGISVLGTKSISLELGELSAGNYRLIWQIEGKILAQPLVKK